MKRYSQRRGVQPIHFMRGRYRRPVDMPRYWRDLESVKAYQEDAKHLHPTPTVGDIVKIIFFGVFGIAVIGGAIQILLHL